MSSVEISSTAVEPVRFTWLVDGAPSGAPLVFMDVTRMSTTLGLLDVDAYDFDDDTFKTLATVVTPIKGMEPVNGRSGEYVLQWGGFVTNPRVGGDVYRVTFYADLAGTTIIGTTEIRVGTVDTIDALPATLATAHGAGSWLTGAVAGDAMTLTAPALTAIQAKILDDATPFHGASIATIAAFGAPPTAAAIGTAVWATAYGTPSINTFGWLTWRLAQWGTEIADKAIVGQLLVLRSLDLGTTYASVTLRDKDGGLITPATGEPARFDP